jgi:hypothetical protein
MHSNKKSVEEIMVETIYVLAGMQHNWQPA